MTVKKSGPVKATRKAQPSRSINSDALADDEDTIDSPGFDDSDVDDSLDQDSGEGDLDLLDDDMTELFGEDDLFDEGNAASLEELGFSDPNGGDPNQSNFFRAGLPQNLQAPEPRQGFDQRFVRYLSRSGQKDVKNIMKSQRLGWIPRKVKPGEFKLPTKKIGNTNIIMIDGHVLCEMPVERAATIRQSYQSQTRRQTVAVESQFREEGRQGHVPVGFKEQVQTKVGTRRPNIAPNRKG